MFCAAYSVYIWTFGSTPQSNGEEAREQIRMEGYILAGFSSFVVMYPRKSKHSHNSAAHAERAVVAVRSYYHKK